MGAMRRCKTAQRNAAVPPHRLAGASYALAAPSPHSLSNSLPHLRCRPAAVRAVQRSPFSLSHLRRRIVPFHHGTAHSLPSPPRVVFSPLPLRPPTLPSFPCFSLRTVQDRSSPTEGPASIRAWLLRGARSGSSMQTEAAQRGGCGLSSLSLFSLAAPKRPRPFVGSSPPTKHDDPKTPPHTTLYSISHTLLSRCPSVHRQPGLFAHPVRTVPEDLRSSNFRHGVIVRGTVLLFCARVCTSCRSAAFCFCSRTCHDRGFSRARSDDRTEGGIALVESAAAVFARRCSSRPCAQRAPAASMQRRSQWSAWFRFRFALVRESQEPDH